jgi:hypothetical protein
MTLLVVTAGDLRAVIAIATHECAITVSDDSRSGGWHLSHHHDTPLHRVMYIRYREVCPSRRRKGEGAEAVITGRRAGNEPFCGWPSSPRSCLYGEPASHTRPSWRASRLGRDYPPLYFRSRSE